MMKSKLLLAALAASIVFSANVSAGKPVGIAKGVMDVSVKHDGKTVKITRNQDNKNRAAKLNDELGGGSLTALPIIETQADDLTAYIPTNVISITDGQIFLNSRLFHSGIRPAINAGLSVSRVGGNAQRKAMKSVTGQLRVALAQYTELEAFAKFGSDLDKATQAQLTRGRRLVEILKQSQYSPLSVAKQTFIILMANEGYLDKVEVEDVLKVEEELYSTLDSEYRDFMDEMIKDKLTDETKEKMRKIFEKVISKF